MSLNIIDNNDVLKTSFSCKTEGKRFPLALITVLLIVGVTIAYAHNTTPAPFLETLFTFYKIDPVTGAVLLNLTMSIIYPGIIIGSLWGTSLVERIGTRKLYLLALILVAAGILLTFVSGSEKFALYLVSRVLYGFGFGFTIPAIGAAIMTWYKPKARNFMTTFNAICPFIGAIACYSIFPIVALWYGKGNMLSGWQFGAGFTGFIVLAVLIVWILAVRKDVDLINVSKTETLVPGNTDDEKQKGVFNWLLKIKEVRLIMILFACDFLMYAYLATILPFWLMNAGNLPESKAGALAAIAFPVAGVIGALSGGIATNFLGRRKSIIVICQIIKLAGLLITCLLSDQSYIFIFWGTILFGLGNGGWMPAMLLIPVELPGTNPARVGGGFSLFLSTGFVFGFIAPILGGVLTTAFANFSGLSETLSQINYGYKWSFFILSLSHIIAVVAAVMLRETGPGRSSKQ